MFRYALSDEFSNNVVPIIRNMRRRGNKTLKMIVLTETKCDCITSIIRHVLSNISFIA